MCIRDRFWCFVCICPVWCLDALLPAITTMINLSHPGETFPNNWKLADVKPRLKKTGVDALFINLRPISNLSFASKLTGKAVFAQIHKHLTTNKLCPKAHSAYREFHSTETALLRVKNDILLNVNQQRVTLLVLLDLSTAFDTVDHTILLNIAQPPLQGLWYYGTCVLLV